MSMTGRNAVEYTAVEGIYITLYGKNNQTLSSAQMAPSPTQLMCSWKNISALRDDLRPNVCQTITGLDTSTPEIKFSWALMAASITMTFTASVSCMSTSGLPLRSAERYWSRWRLLLSLSIISICNKSQGTSLKIIFSSFQEWANAMARRLSSVRPSVNFCTSRFFSHANGRIAAKLAHNGLQVSVHPGCAQGQGQGSRDTCTFLDSWNELLRHWRSGHDLCCCVRITQMHIIENSGP